jgi:lactoylglutathione lyase
LVEEIRAKGGNVTRESSLVRGESVVIDFVKDPDGYLFELIQGSPAPESLSNHASRWALDQAINFHEMICGMKLLRKSDNLSYEYTIAMLDMPMRKETTFLELTYNYGVNKYNRGNDHGVNKYSRGNEQ